MVVRKLLFLAWRDARHQASLRNPPCLRRSLSS